MPDSSLIMTVASQVTDPTVVKAVTDNPVIKSAADWFAVLGLGAVGGMLGQGARVVVGLKKLNDAASAPGNTKSVADMIEPSRLFISLLIGAIAGALAATTTVGDLTKIALSTLMGLAAAGYLGTDFIEGFMSRFKPKDDAANSAQTPASDGAEG